MKDKVLSIKQVEHLKKLGYNTEGAQIYWVRRSHGSRFEDDSKGKWFLSLQKDFMTVGFISYEVIPTFTLQDILNRLPPLVHINRKDEGILSVEGPGSAHVLTINRDNECCTIGYQFGNSYFGIGRGNTFIEAAYKALCELLKRGLVK